MGPWLVVGLGNPGPQYAGNRHNVGQMVLDVLAGRMNGSFTTHKARAQVLDGRVGFAPGGAPGPRAILAKPASYMNVSGGPVGALAKFYDVPAERVLVVHDELDLPADTLRLKLGGGEGGHNGLRSISSALGTKNYLRLRVGIGRPPGRTDPADYVLRDFSAVERPGLAVTLEEAADAVEEVLQLGLEKAQLRLHTA
ncbi:aminoacyl-tRNA hydrolase [Georgenia sp. SUBG003]|uniref:aminoacyl-tRNA hydrolase n=1 Tax=Georgenia sp. SUBG003 TaxID=1497974 RepID=UPI0004D89FA8|nr:peptidyl-tRNA hydrolase [Georgenia sp. SUBG003]